MVGDSQMLDMYKALKCFVLELWDLQSRPVHPDLRLQNLFTHNIEPECLLLGPSTRLCFLLSSSGSDLVSTRPSAPC